MANDFTLAHNAFGHLELTAADGAVVEVMPVRSFPISAPDEGVALVSTDGREVAWFERLSELPAALRTAIESELAIREFMPEISRIVDVSSFATPSTWQVDTDRGQTKLLLKGEEDIRRLGQAALLIADANGVQFLVRDIRALDAHSRKLLDRFL